MTSRPFGDLSHFVLSYCSDLSVPQTPSPVQRSRQDLPTHAHAHWCPSGADGAAWGRPLPARVVLTKALLAKTKLTTMSDNLAVGRVCMHEGRIGGGGRVQGVRTPLCGPRYRLFNIGPKVGPPLGPLCFACRSKNLIDPPFQKSWIRPSYRRVCMHSVRVYSYV